jgi:type IV pilus assembly protein PilO
MPQKNRNLVILAVAVVLIGGISYAYWSMVYGPAQQAIATDRRTVDDLTQKLAAAKARAGQLNKIQAEMASLQVDVAELEKLLPKGRELPSLIRVLTHRAETHGLYLSSVAPQRPVPKGLYDEIGYNISVTSSFHSIGHFLTAMGKGDRLFAARNLAFSGTSSKTDPSKTVNATFTLIAFKYHE